jgi:adapter protein MecA 1/2
MRFEKIDENRISIILTIDDLKAHNIDIRNFKSNSVAYQQLFWDMMEHAQEELGFDVSDSQLLVETAPDAHGNFVITITKSKALKNPIEEIDKLISGKIASIFDNASASTIGFEFTDTDVDEVEEYPFEVAKFNNIDDLIDMAIMNPSLSSLSSMLYNYNGSYYLSVKRNKRNYKQINKFFNMVYEFNGEIIEPFLMLPIIEEHGSVIIKTRALRTLASKFGERV